MKLIILRGLPGTGKTIIAKILKKIFFNSEIISIDKLKIQALKSKYSFLKANKIGFEKSMQELSKLSKTKEVIILEEIICNKKFYHELNNFIKDMECELYWFRITRKLNHLLAVESKRKRKIKNTKKDFLNLKKEIEMIEIKSEHKIKNDDLGKTIKEILDILI